MENKQQQQQKPWYLMKIPVENMLLGEKGSTISCNLKNQSN